MKTSTAKALIRQTYGEGPITYFEALRLRGLGRKTLAALEAEGYPFIQDRLSNALHWHLRGWPSLLDQLRREKLFTVPELRAFLLATNGWTQQRMNRHFHGKQKFQILLRAVGLQLKSRRGRPPLITYH